MPKAKANAGVNIQAQIQGNITGQVAIGQNIVQIGDVHGGFVYLAAEGESPAPQPRPAPVILRPRPAAGMLDRDEEVQQAKTALQTRQPVDLFGEAGEGKTTLLRRLAHEIPVESAKDGIVCLSARQRPLADLLQEIYEAFYECKIPVKPTGAQLKHALGAKEALIFLDDVELTREETDELLDTAPACTFLFCSTDRRLWSGGRSLPVHGLPPEIGLQLIQREMGRTLSAAEDAAARQVCEAMQGNPLRILQALAPVTEGSCELTGLAAKTVPPSTPESVLQATIESRPEPKRRLLGLLALLRGAWVRAEHLAAIAQSPEAPADLEALQEERLVEFHEGKYCLARNLAQVLPGSQEKSLWSERILAHLVPWAEQNRNRPRQLTMQADCLIAALQLAVECGQWREALRLARAIEGALALAGLWDSWKRALDWGLQAARALGEPGAEAWALHQLGTRALCLGDAAPAGDLLRQALKLWESEGDKVGAAITRNNLHILLPPPIPIPKPTRWITAGKIGGLLLTGILAVPVVKWIIDSNAPTAALSSVTVSPSEVTGGAEAQGAIVLDRAAPAGGASINLRCDRPDVAEVPARVTVLQGATRAQFQVRSRPVRETVRLVVSADYGNRTVQGALGVLAQALNLNGLEVRPVELVGGTQAEGAVTISGPAPPGGLTVELLSSDEQNVAVPASVAIGAGATRGTFAVRTNPVGQSVPARITARFRTDTLDAGVMVKSPVLVRLELRPASVPGGGRVQGVAILNGLAPPPGVLIRLFSDADAASVPQEVTVSPGSEEAQFPVRTLPIRRTERVRISGSSGGIYCSAELEVQPAPDLTAIARLRLNRASVVGGDQVEAEVELSNPAPPGGAKILFSAQPDVVDALQTVVIAPGNRSVRIPLKTGRVTRITQVIVSAQVGENRESAMLELRPPDIRLPAIQRLTLSPSSVTGGDFARGIVVLSANAPPGGINITLRAQPDLVQIPAGVTIQAGSRSADFRIGTRIASEPARVEIAAIAASSEGRAVLDIQAREVVLDQLRLSRDTVEAGMPVEGTVTLSGPAILGGKAIRLSSDNPARVQVPGEVMLEAGQRSATFTLTTNPPRTPTGRAGVDVRKSRVMTGYENVQATVKVSATDGRLVREALLTVVPKKAPVAPTDVKDLPAAAGVMTAKTFPVAVRLVSVGVEPRSLRPEQSFTLTIQLSGPAPAGGIKVALTSSDPGLVPAPGWVLVPAGQSVLNQALKTGPYRSEGIFPAWIRASLGDDQKQADLSVGIIR